MEVHHHPHVEKKNFREYLLEGLMIFVAVSMGFIAENIRDHLVNKEHEASYIASFYKDLNTNYYNTITFDIFNCMYLYNIY